MAKKPDSKLVVHSRAVRVAGCRPMHRSAGKALMPDFSGARNRSGQRQLDQNLLDLQTAEMDALFERTCDNVVLAIISGDSLMRPKGLPRSLPKADIVCLGFEAPAEEATAFGTFFTPWGKEGHVDFFLQKPSRDQINALSETHRCLVDAGVWFFSEKAAMALMVACGWDVDAQSFPTGARTYDLYAQFGLGLGEHPSEDRNECRGLTTTVVPAGHDFYHFGTNQQLVDAVIQLQSGAGPIRSDLGFTTAARRRLNQHALNCVFEEMPDFAHDAKIWMENSIFAKGSTFDGNNIVTNVPALPYPVYIPRNGCLDFVPIDEEDWCVRVYGFEDKFGGAFGNPNTRLMAQSPEDWLKRLRANLRFEWSLFRI